MCYSIKKMKDDSMSNLIQPIQAGQQLLDDIRETTSNQGEVAIWWLGQSGYAIKTANALFYVDLYLSEHLTKKYAATEKPHIRMTEAPLRGADLRDMQLIFASHKHSDHLDPGSISDIFANNPDVRLVLSAALKSYAVETLGLDENRLIPTMGGETLTLGNLTVHIIPSAHPDIATDDEGNNLFIGFVFEVDGVTLYHSGDTLAYDGLADRLKPYNVDIAFLPINGTDERRTQLHVPPNMNIDDALQLAHAIGDPLIIPHHYDMFTFNTVDVSLFEAKADSTGQAYKVMHCGEKFLWRKD